MVISPSRWAQIVKLRRRKQAANAAPVPDPYTHVYGVEFMGGTNNGLGQRMLADGATVGGEERVILSAYFEVGSQVPCVLASQWATDSGQNSWILAMTRDGEYAAGGNGLRWWMQSSTPIAYEYEVTLVQGQRVHVVVDYNGAEAVEDDRVTMYISIDGSTFEEVALDRYEHFGATTPPTSLPASTEPIYVGGAAYATARSMTGIMIDTALWTGTEAAALDIAALDEDGAPTDFSALAPLHWWRFGDGAGDTGTTIVDLGSGEIDGELENGGAPAYNPEIVTLAEFSSAFAVTFDGANEYIEVANNSTLDLSDQFSIALWLRASEFVAGEIYARREVSTSDLAFRLQVDTVGTDEMLLMVGGSGTYARTTNLNLAVDTWYLVVVVFDGNAASGSRITWYRNGAGGITDTEISVPATTDNTNAATRVAWPSAAVPGRIREFAFYNRALTSQEVADMYDDGTFIVGEDSSGRGTRIWWRMGDGHYDSHPTIRDQSGHINDGTMTNMESGDIAAV